MIIQKFNAVINFIFRVYMNGFYKKIHVPFVENLLNYMIRMLKDRKSDTNNESSFNTENLQVMLENAVYEFFCNLRYKLFLVFILMAIILVILFFISFKALLREHNIQEEMAYIHEACKSNSYVCFNGLCRECI